MMTDEGTREARCPGALDAVDEYAETAVSRRTSAGAVGRGTGASGAGVRRGAVDEAGPTGGYAGYWTVVGESKE